MAPLLLPPGPADVWKDKGSTTRLGVHEPTKRRPGAKGTPDDLGLIFFRRHLPVGPRSLASKH